VAEPSHFTLTSIGVLLSPHLNVVLGIAASTIICIERAIAPIKDIHLRVSELGIAIVIRGTIAVSNELSPIGS
jgi:hypothetical protein